MIAQYVPRNYSARSERAIHRLKAIFTIYPSIPLGAGVPRGYMYMLLAYLNLSHWERGYRDSGGGEVNQAHIHGG